MGVGLHVANEAAIATVSSKRGNDMKRKSLTPDQLKAGRALAGITLSQLAEKANTTRQTLWRYQKGLHDTVDWKLRAVREALEQKGVVFLSANDEHASGVARRL